MPWVDEDKCVGCGVCVQQCPTDAISLKDGKAEIDMEKCIRCGRCHEACPQNAVRHDSERIPQRLEENLDEIKELINNFKPLEEKKAFLGRMLRHYKMEKRIVEGTIKEIERFQESIKQL
jgi:ferredoxin